MIPFLWIVFLLSRLSSSFPQRIVHLLTLASSVTSGLSEVHPDAVGEVQMATREFYASLRLIYSSLLTHIRTHAGELQQLGQAHGASGSSGSNLGGGGGPSQSAVAAAAAAASIAAAAHEYRRNVYLDHQTMQVALEAINLQKERISQLATQIESQPQTTTGRIKEEGQQF